MASNASVKIKDLGNMTFNNEEKQKNRKNEFLFMPLDH